MRRVRRKRRKILIRSDLVFSLFVIRNNEQSLFEGTAVNDILRVAFSSILVSCDAEIASFLCMRNCHRNLLCMLIHIVPFR